MGRWPIFVFAIKQVAIGKLIAGPAPPRATSRGAELQSLWTRMSKIWAVYPLDLLAGAVAQQGSSLRSGTQRLQISIMPIG